MTAGVFEGEMMIMKKTQLLDARRNIQKEIVAYISIVMIGILASLAYLSIAYSAATLKKDAVEFFSSHDLWDLEVTSTMLMDEDDLGAICTLPGVKETERVYQIDTKLRVGNDISSVAVLSLPKTISPPMLHEGRLPETPEECAVEKELMDGQGLTIGQRIEVDNNPISDVVPLLNNSFVITGVFQTPDHITYMVPVTPYIFICEDSFNREGFGGAFMKTRIRVDGAPENRYSEAYWDTIRPVGKALEKLGEERVPVRRQKILSVYEEQLREGEAQVKEGAEKLRQAQEQLEQGRKELEAAAEKLGLGKDMLDYGEQQLALLQGLIDQGDQKLQEIKQNVSYVWSLLGNGRDWFLANVTEKDWPSDFSISYAQVRTALENGEDVTMDWLNEKSGYTFGTQILKIAESQKETARINWYYAGEEYLDGVTRYEKGKKQLEEGEREIAEGRAKYDAAEKDLQKARDELDQLEDEGRWVVLNDRGNAGFVYAETNSDKLASLSMSFSSIFLVVGALVIYATIGRMVEQHRKLIGATKAMGLYNREIFAKYLFFACTAALLGVGLGIFLAWLPVQRIILNSYEKLFTYGTGTSSFLPLETGLVVAGAFTISVVAVFLGCSQLLRMSAINLMQGVTPSAGRKKARKSAEKNLYSRLILLNMRTDWKRVLVTIVSIAGGCILMVVGFTLRYGIGGVTAKQFGGILTYEAEVFYNDDENPDAAMKIDQILDQNVLPHINVNKSAGIFDADGTLSSLTMIIAEKGSVDGYYNLRGINSGDPVDLPDSGVLVPRRFWENYGIDVGENVMIYGPDMKLTGVKVAGVFENYYGQLFFMTPQGYQEAFGSVPKNNCYFVRTNGMSLEGLQQMVSGVEGLTSVNDAAAERTMIEQFTASLNFVVWFMLFIAAMMACFIVANFTMTYIQRKTRELTIMRINGFTVGECIRYAAVDLVITTIFGTILGLALGNLLGARILSVTETPYIQMIREPAIQTYLYSGLITFVFSAVTNGFALQKLKRLKLSDVD